jgi:hypothetical protein
MRSRFVAAAAVWAAAIMGAGSSPGQTTLYVDRDAVGPVHDGSNWCEAYLALADALAVAEASGGAVTEIRVAGGVYRPDQGIGQTPGDRTARFWLQTGVALRGGYAGCGVADPDDRDIKAYEAILSGDLAGDDGPDFTNTGDNSYHVMIARGTDETAILDGFTISGGYADRTGSIRDGGGIYNDGGSPTIVDCTFIRNYACGDGGGMSNRGGAGPTLTGCVFWENAADDTGGGMDNNESSPTLLGCTFDRNTAEHGGGMYDYGSSPSLTDCLFSGNVALDTGAGLCNWNESNPNVTNCDFIGNQNDDWGGGMVNRYGSHPVVTGCLFKGNHAGFGAGMGNWESDPTLVECTFAGNIASVSGGGMLNHDSGPSLTDCVFRGNTAGYHGGGMYNNAHADPVLANCLFAANTAGDGGAVGNNWSHPTATNCTFADNAATLGRALACDSWQQSYPSSVELTDCILWNGGDEVWTNDGSVVLAGYSVVYGGWPGDGNIDLDPLFAPGPAGSYYLAQTAAGQPVDSPCLNAGSGPAAAPHDTMTTRTDEAVDTDTVDMGYHYPVTGRPLVMGDFDRDGDGDLTDSAALQNCFTGEGPAEVPPCCRIFDLEPDDDVDLVDYAGFFDAFLSGCGNGVIEAGEECDPPDGTVCDADCQRIPGTGPLFDDCGAPGVVTDGTITFDNIGATTDGPDEPEMCDFFDYTQIDADIWFCYTATGPDLLTVSLCGSSFDTKLAVYDGCECLTDLPIACSDDNCGMAVESRVTLTAIEGASYLIRIGGFEGAQGEGFLTILCGAGSPCGPGAGDCFEPNGSPGCEDEDCCDTACAIDQYCCDVEWDEFCVGMAEGLCGGLFGACVDGVGDCYTPHAGVGCDNEACCQEVCESDPFCCLTEWDGLCAEAAGELCGVLDACIDGVGSCFAPHPGPGCDDEACCLQVCAVAPFCCQSEWDEVCVEFAAICRR